MLRTLPECSMICIMVLFAQDRYDEGLPADNETCIIMVLSSSRYRKAAPQALLAVLCAALLTAFAACAPSLAPVLTGAAAPYRPATIASDVASRPGAVAWSPDGRYLAFIGRTVTIVDITAEPPVPEHIAINGPRYLAWADDGTLSVLSRERDQDILVLIDAARTDILRKALNRRADAVYPVDHRRSLLLSLEAARLKFGTELRWSLSLLDIANGTASTLLSNSRIVPAAVGDRDLLTAWAHAGLNPLDGSFLIMELIKPPALAPYSRVQAFDPASGDLVEIGGQDRRAVHASADWSPDGRKIALTGPGGLQVRDLRGSRLLDSSAPGLYPAWHPAGDLLAVGGALVSPATGERTLLLTNSIGSLARWSPDGTRLSVVTGGKLLLFRGFRPTAPPAVQLDRGLKKRLTMLQELLQDDLITREEYRARRTRLLSIKEDGPR